MTRLLFSALLSAILSLTSLLALAQGRSAPPPTDESASSDSRTPARDDSVSPQKLLEGAKTMEGFIKLHQKDESVYAEIQKSALNKPFLLSISLARGVAQGRIVSGMTRAESIYYWRLADKRLFLVEKNVRHMAKSGDPISRAVEADFSDSIIAVLTVRAQSGSSVIVNLGELLFTDFSMVGRDLQRELGANYSLDTKRTVWGKIKTFPENVEIQVEATYAGSGGSDLRTVPDSRAVSITKHYSFSSIPSGDYKPRAADPRIGYFLTARMDYSQGGYQTPFLRYINRWKLEKANPKAALSPPKRPIVFYIEKSVPYEYRPIVREGVLEWNKAFERAGFIDAIEVRFQEDDADWDAEDVRYNTIRWMTGEATYAIGPSRTNPLTGEIYDADILIASSWLRFFERQYDYYAGEAAAFRENPAPVQTLDDYLRSIERRIQPTMHDDEHHALYSCELASGLTEQMAIAAAVASSADEDTTSAQSGVIPEFIRQGLKELIMHEVGHTLGLRHNFKASSTIPLKDLHNTEVTARTGLSGSVMDYNIVNIAPKGTKQGHWFTPTLGAWDYLAIEYGYTQPTSPGDEKKVLARIAERAALPEHAYGTDGDVGAAVDPLTNQRDMGDDLLAFSKQRTQIMTELWGGLIERLVKEGEGYQSARSAFYYTLSDLQRAQYFAAGYVGGIKINRNHRGDEGEQPPLDPVSPALQREALAFVRDEVLSDSANAFDSAFIAKLGPDRWDHWGAESPSRFDHGLYDRVLSGQLRVLNRLFSPSVLNRVQESRLYVSEDTVPLTINDVYAEITEGVWTELDQDSSRDTWNAAAPFISDFRRNLQRAYLKFILLTHTLNPSSSLPQDARSAAWMELRGLAVPLDRLIDRIDAGELTLDAASEAHLRESHGRIAKALEAAFSVDNY